MFSISLSFLGYTRKGGKKMLQYEALRQLTHELHRDRQRQAEAMLLAQQARGRGRRHTRRRALALLRYRRGAAQTHGA